MFRVKYIKFFFPMNCRKENNYQLQPNIEVASADFWYATWHHQLWYTILSLLSNASIEANVVRMEVIKLTWAYVSVHDSKPPYRISNFETRELLK